MTPTPSAGRGRIFCWTLFDFANTGFSVVIVTVVFSRYFTNHVAGGERWLWGLAVSCSMIVAALLSPPLGAAADASGKRKRFLLLFTLLCVAATALLFFVEAGMVALGILLFVLANIGFEGGLVFYDAFLPGITSPRSYGRVSGYGFAMGYLGALAILLILMAMLPGQLDPHYLLAVRLSFVVAAAFFLVFSLPMFLFVPEPPAPPSPSASPSSGRPASYLATGMRRSWSTLRTLVGEREYRPVAKFLLAFFIYNDGILTVIAFAAIFADHILHMGDREIIVFFAVVQTSAIVGSLIFGFITDKIGPKKTILITLLLWMAISCGAYFTTTVAFFYAVAMAAGIAIGSSQSASRSFMALVTPREREAEFFGFYDGLCGKASGVVGPLLYGVVADFTSERVAALGIGLFFVAGWLILRTVPAPSPAGPSRAAAGSAVTGPAG